VSELELRGAVIAAGVLAGLPVVAALPHLLRAIGFERVNFQGRPIGSAAGLLFLLAGALWLFIGPHREGLVATAVTGFGLLGLIDDRWGTAEFKGLRGHLRALTTGRVTTGLIKAVGGALLAGWLAWRLQPSAAALPSMLLIALSANLFNLLDLRPLRTLKAFWAFALSLVWAGPLLLAALLGLSVPYSRLEARRSVMLGDVGANGLGAATGVAAAQLLPPAAQVILVALLLAFHLWAEKHSLSAWIASHAWADAVDRWGWQDRAA
jgi:UDP-N-acetylmuramyl pentapeptide phosphotransferase/UDP-N-acetylglucosamine-1-phosphate transferase